MATHGDPSHELDLVTVFEPAGAEAEMEAENVKGLLEAAGIEAVLVGDTRLPNFPFAVRVSRADAENARNLIEQATQIGSAAAEAEERETEQS